MHQLDTIFRPRSIAIIGASQFPGKIGWEIVHNIIKYEFQGKLFPVNPRADFVHSMKCYRSVVDIPDHIDLAILSVPRSEVLAAVDECGKKGIPGLVVITAGFKEVNQEGAALEKQLVEKVRYYGMRMVGPNCMGIINTDPAIRLDATFAPELPVRGSVGFISQSGALGVTILSLSRERHLGFSMFASIGNKSNLSSNDLLEYWEEDPDTQMVLLYLENFGNPRKFTQLARRFTRNKPVLAVKSGRTGAGAKAASSHTGALVTLDVGTDAIFEQCGVLRANTIDELFDYATALSSQPLPADNRVAILTNAGGPGIMATDAGVSSGLQLAEYTSGTREALRKIIPPESNPNNPLDLLAGATPDHYEKALDVLLQDPGVSAVLVISVPPIMVDPVKVATAVSRVASRFSKPVLGCFMGVQDILRTIQQTSQSFSCNAGHIRNNEKPASKTADPELHFQGSVIPLYAFPESAVRALNGMVRYAQIRRRTYEEPIRFPVNKTDTENIFRKVHTEERSVLTQREVHDVLVAYGIPVPLICIAKSPEEAAVKAREIGFPVVMKALMKTRQHKSDFGGVAIDLRNTDEVLDAYRHMESRIADRDLTHEFEGVYLQPMVRGGKEVILGVSYDNTFGSLLMFGMGGIYVETMKDTIFRTIPITNQDARQMIESVKGYPVLKGVRGEPSVDLSFLAEILQRCSQLASDFYFIREMEINPFVITPEQNTSLAVDARIYPDWSLLEKESV